MTEPGQKRSPLQKRWLVLAAVVVLALIFLIPFIQEGGARVDTTVMVDTETAFVGEIQETAQGRGQIDSAESTPVQAQYAGKLATVTVEEGDVVEQGDILAVYDTKNLEEQMNELLDELDELDAQIAQADKSGSSYITAEVSGLVKSIHAKRGDVVTNVVETQGGLMEISTDGRLRVTVTLPKDTDLAVGDLVTVQIGEQSEEGVVVHLESQESRTVARITFDDSPDYALGETVQVSSEAGDSLGSGIVGANSPYLVRGDYGIISKVNVEIGDAVEEGDILFTRIEAEYNAEYLDLLDQRMDLIGQLFSLQEFTKDPLLLSESRGIVADLTLEAGDQVEAGDKVCRLISTDNFTLSVDIVETDIGRVQPGQRVQLQFDAFEDVTYWGRVEKISSLGKQVGGLTAYTVTISLKGAEGLKVAMNADATIILASASDALLVPVRAVQIQEDGSEAVEISYGDGLTRVCKVETGLRNEDYVQILSGVQEGDEVVVASRVVETKVFSLFSFEWVIDQDEESSAEEHTD
ncbi:MAG: HlyD family efflux transporter periplasmic adaptor subunit [Candidatus Onthomonas sp.]